MKTQVLLLCLGVVYGAPVEYGYDRSVQVDNTPVAAASNPAPQSGYGSPSVAASDQEPKTAYGIPAASANNPEPILKSEYETPTIAASNSKPSFLNTNDFQPKYSFGAPTVAASNPDPKLSYGVPKRTLIGASSNPQGNIILDENGNPFDPNPSYNFEYDIVSAKTGDQKYMKENRENGVVTGEYSYVDPVGTLRIVRYEASADTGYIATVETVPGYADPPPMPKPITITKPLTRRLQQPIPASSSPQRRTTINNVSDKNAKNRSTSSKRKKTPTNFTRLRFVPLTQRVLPPTGIVRVARPPVILPVTSRVSVPAPAPVLLSSPSPVVAVPAQPRVNVVRISGRGINVQY